MSAPKPLSEIDDVDVAALLRDTVRLSRQLTIAEETGQAEELVTEDDSVYAEQIAHAWIQEQLESHNAALRSSAMYEEGDSDAVLHIIEVNDSIHGMSLVEDPALQNPGKHVAMIVLTVAPYAQKDQIKRRAQEARRRVLDEYPGLYNIEAVYARRAEKES